MPYASVTLLPDNGHAPPNQIRPTGSGAGSDVLAQFLGGATDPWENCDFADGAL